MDVQSLGVIVRMISTAQVQGTKLAQLPHRRHLTLAPRLRPTLIQILARIMGKEVTATTDTVITGKVGMAGRVVTREADVSRLLPHIYYDKGRWRVAMANVSYGEDGPVEVNMPALVHVARLNGRDR